MTAVESPVSEENYELFKTSTIMAWLAKYGQVNYIGSEPGGASWFCGQFGCGFVDSNVDNCLNHVRVHYPKLFDHDDPQHSEANKRYSRKLKLANKERTNGRW